MQTMLAVVVLVIVALVAVQIVIAGRFRGRILKKATRLRRLPRPEARRDLPDIVYAFARKCGADPDAPPRYATFHQSAELRLRPGAAFVPVEAWQIIALGKPAFLWDARAAGIAPKFRVFDSYLESKGLLEARAFGSIPVARANGELTDIAEAMRYLAELPWAPDAILGNREIAWRQIDAEHVEAALAVHDGAARVVFRFNDEGDIAAVAAKARPAQDAAGKPARYDWRGRYSGYHELGGRRVPVEAEIGYIFPKGYETYFRGEITDYQLDS